MSTIRDSSNLVTIQIGGDLTFALSTTKKLKDGAGKILVRVNETGHLFLVSRQVMLDSARYFKTLLDGPFKEGGKDFVQLEEENSAVVELWLRCLHGFDFADNSSTDIFFEFSIKEVFEIIQFSFKYGLETEKLNSWFSTYWKKLDLNSLDLNNFKELLYPTMTFDHPWAFAWTSRYLIFNGVGHVEEKNPTGFPGLRSPKGVINQINACRGSMKREINKEIMKHLRSFKQPTPLSKSCACRAFARDNYVEALDETGVWPIDERPLSINAILAGLAHFDYDPPPKACTRCSFDITFSGLISRMRVYIDGLCLDCMDSTNPKTGSLDTDYWMHNSLSNWDKGCRIDHGRNTWYFSYMGRPEQMEAHQREMKERKNQRFRAQEDRERAEHLRVLAQIERAKKAQAMVGVQRAQAETSASGSAGEMTGSAAAAAQTAAPSIFGP